MSEPFVHESAIVDPGVELGERRQGLALRARLLGGAHRRGLEPRAERVRGARRAHRCRASRCRTTSRSTRASSHRRRRVPRPELRVHQRRQSALVRAAQTRVSRHPRGARRVDRRQRHHRLRHAYRRVRLRGGRRDGDARRRALRAGGGLTRSPQGLHVPVRREAGGHRARQLSRPARATIKSTENVVCPPTRSAAPHPCRSWTSTLRIVHCSTATAPPSSA